jgi:putative transposase
MANMLVYNKCVEASELAGNDRITKQELRHMLIDPSSTMLEGDEYDLLFANPRVPYAFIDSAIDDFQKAFILQKRLVKAKKKKRFKMHYRSIKHHSSFMLPSSKINKFGHTQITFYSTSPGLGTFIIKEDIPFDSIDHDCRISWNGLDVFKIHISYDYDRTKNKHQPSGVCAIDPGVRTFATVYSDDGTVYNIGEGINKKVDKVSLIAGRMRSGIERVKVNGKKVFRKTTNKRTLKHLRRKAKQLEERNKNVVRDFHNSVVKMLTNTFETIIIPVFNTKQMCTKKNLWRRKISKTTARQLNRMGHYTFRQKLIEKAGERVVVGTEEWTSKTCGNCFKVHPDLGDKKVFDCPHCGVVMDRDVNAARLIMLLNWEKAELQHQGYTHPTEGNFQTDHKSIASETSDVIVSLMRPSFPWE